MLRKFPKDDTRFRWTSHIKNKMLYYNLSEQRIRRVLHSPKRLEEGIAPQTIAAMQRSVTKKKPEEIWVMYQIQSQSAKSEQPLQKAIPRSARVLMISAWRYPGISKPGAAIPIPEDIAAELEIMT